MVNRRVFFSVGVVLFLGCIGSMQGAVKWETNYKEALASSKQENKPLLLFFTGSDWSGTAMRMKQEILDAASFQNQVATRFICLEVDFPQHSLLSQERLEQNNLLKERFEIKEWPSLLLLDSQEREIARLGYLPESGEQLAQDLLRVVAQDQCLAQGLEKLGSDSTELKSLYQVALELGRSGAMEKILQAGYVTNDSFFSLEKYRLLVDQGKMDTEEAKMIKEGLLTLHSPETCFTLALIEFQELSKLPKSQQDPHKAVKPLEEYLAKFADCPQENIWRVEMMIAQHYLDADEWVAALKHAETAYKAAPLQVRPEIEHSLDYIRQQACELTQKSN